MIWRYNAYISLCKLSSSGGACQSIGVDILPTFAALLGRLFFSGIDNLGISDLSKVPVSLQDLQLAPTSAVSHVRGYSACHVVLHHGPKHACNGLQTLHSAVSQQFKQGTRTYTSTSSEPPTNSFYGRHTAASALLKSILDVPGSYAMLRAHLGRTLSPQMLQELSELCLSRLHTLTANHACDLLWAICSFGQPGLSKSLVQSLQSIVAQGVTMCTRDQVIAAVFAVNQTAPCDPQVVSTLSDRVWELGPKLTARQVAVAASSLAQLSQQWEDEHLPEVLATLAARARELILDFTPTELMCVLKAMALARHPDELLFREATQALLPVLQQKGNHEKRDTPQLADIHPSDMAAALAACAVVQHHNPSFFQAATDWLLKQPQNDALHAAHQQATADDDKAKRDKWYDWESDMDTVTDFGSSGQGSGLSLIQDAADSAITASITQYPLHNQQLPPTALQPLSRPSESMSQEEWLQYVYGINSKQLNGVVKQTTVRGRGTRALITNALEGSARVLDPRVPEPTATLCMLSKQRGQPTALPATRKLQAETSDHNRTLTPEALVTAVLANAIAGTEHSQLFDFAERLFDVVTAPTISMDHAAMLMSTHVWTAQKPKASAWKGYRHAQFNVGISQAPAAFVSYMHHHMADQKLKEPYLTKLQSAMQALGHTPVPGLPCSYDGLIPISLAYAIPVNASTQSPSSQRQTTTGLQQDGQAIDKVQIPAGAPTSVNQQISKGRSAVNNSDEAADSSQQHPPVTSFVGTKPVAVEVVLETDCLASPLHQLNGPTSARMDALAARGWIIMTVMQHECDALPPNDPRAWEIYTAAKLQLCLNKARKNL